MWIDHVMLLKPIEIASVFPWWCEAGRTKEIFLRVLCLHVNSGGEILYKSDKRNEEKYSSLQVKEKLQCNSKLTGNENTNGRNAVKQKVL